MVTSMQHVNNLIDAFQQMHPAIVIGLALIISVLAIAIARNLIRAVFASVLLLTVAVLSMPSGLTLVNQVKDEPTWSQRAECAREFMTDAGYWTGATPASCPVHVGDIKRAQPTTDAASGSITASTRSKLVAYCQGRIGNEQARQVCRRKIVLCIEKRVPARQLTAMANSTSNPATSARLNALVLACR